MRKIKNWIVILTIIVILFIAVLLLLKKQEKQENTIDDQQFYTDDSSDNLGDFEISTEVQEVTDAIMYYTVKNCIQEYVSASYELEINSNENAKQTLYNMLSERYIKDNNVKIDNLQNIIKIYSNEFKILDMKLLDGEKIQTYCVNVKYNEGNENLIVYIDNENYTFSIFPIKTTIEKNNIKPSFEKIKINNNNELEYADIDNRAICNYYLMDYKENLQNNALQAYELLNDEYKRKRFGTLEIFNEYLEDSKDIISKIELESYKANYENEYIEYICKDKLGNYYFFRTTAVMKYTVILDTYTISKGFQEKYAQASSKEKTILNIEKFINMIKARDYKSAYATLNVDFRNNNFSDYYVFKEYVKNIFSEANISYENFEELSDYYTIDIVVDKNNNKIEKTIIMKLKEENEFELSFNI